MDIKVNGRTLSDRPLVLGVQGDNNVEELRFLVPRYTDAGVDLSLGIGYAVFRLHDGTDGHVSLSPEVLETDESTVSLTLLVGSQMTEQKGSGKLCLKVAGLESAMWSSTICDMFVNGTIAMPSPQPVSLFRMRRAVEPRLAEDESEPPLTVTERTINIPAELQTIAVAQDENSETVKIVVPRYFDGQDLSVHDFILHTEMGSNGTDDILFNNQNGQMKAVEDSTVTLTWVLRPPQTSYEGKLNIQLLVQGEEFKWHSLIGELTIAKHITGDPVVPATPSMYEQWLAEVKEQADYVRSQASNIQSVVNNMTAIKAAPAAAGRAEKAAEDAKKAASESKGFRTFFSAVRPDANGNLDPSRPMTVGPAASVEIESAGDRIQSVTALGFTKQAGSGDPSPTNVRALTNGGLRMYKLVIDGSQSVTKETSVGGTVYYKVNVTCPANVDGTSVAGYSKQYCNRAQTKNADGQTQGDYAWVYGKNLCRIAFFSKPWITTAEAMQADLAADPLIIWYIPADESQATGLYAPIILTSGEYRATCLPLTAPLCEGDSVVSLAKSGCDKVLVLDGQNDGLRVQSINSLDIVNFSLFQPEVLNIINSICYSEYLPNVGDTPIANATSPGLTIFGNTIYSRLAGADLVSYGYAEKGNTAQALTAGKAYFAAHPLTVWYRSTNYTEAADIPVSLETHQQAVLVLDGTESVDLYWNGNRDQQLANGRLTFSVAGQAFQNINAAKCSHFAYYSDVGAGVGDQVGFLPLATNRFYFCMDLSTIGASASDIDETLQSKVSAYLAAQYAAGTPVTIVYQFATPITYAHPPVVLEAATGEQLTYTVTGQSGGTVSVALKPFQDGGNAKTADNAANAQNAVNAQTANNSQQLGGLTLSALQNRLVPVGYIFSWAPASGGPDLSTAQKVAAYFGFGTWQAYGNGQVLVGLDAGQTEFAAVGKTGGEKLHKMTISEMPRHQHEVKWSSEGGTGSGNGVLVRDTLSGGPWPYSYWTGGDGGDQPHNNLQPYITVYRWQRVK